MGKFKVAFNLLNDGDPCQFNDIPLPSKASIKATYLQPKLLTSPQFRSLLSYSMCHVFIFQMSIYEIAAEYYVVNFVIDV